MLSPAEELGLSGAALEARVRRAVTYIPDQTLRALAEGLAEEARRNEVTYDRDGVSEAVRIMLRPLLVMPDQYAYLHSVSARIMDCLKRLPELYVADPDVRRVLALAPEEDEWLRDGLSTLRQTTNPLYGRLDAVCDFTSARWQDSLAFLEPNLSGVGGIHLGPVAETLIMRDIVPTIIEHDPDLIITLPRDQRDLLLQVLLDQARVMGRSGSTICFVEPKYVSEGPDEQSHLVEYYRRRHGAQVVHVDPRELRLKEEEVYSEDVCIDVAYRDYEIRDLLELERNEGMRLDAMRTLFEQNRIVSSIGGEFDHKSCWELFSDEAIAERHFSTSERHLFARHVLWTRRVSDRETTLPKGKGNLPEYIRSHRETLVLKPNRAYGGADVHLGSLTEPGDWESLIDRAVRVQADPDASWVVQSVATLPVHFFPVLDPTGRTHSEPFYAVLGFTPTDHGLGIIARVSQKQVVNVAQRGGLAAVLECEEPHDLRTPIRTVAHRSEPEHEFRERIRQLRDLDAVIRVLEWDEETYLPDCAGTSRGSQLATVESIRQDILVDDRFADLVEWMESSTGGDDLRRAELKRLRRLRDTALSLPRDLVGAFAEARSRTLSAWERAREAEDFSVFADSFEGLLGLLRERAQALPQVSTDNYDALLDQHEPGMTRARLDPLLASLGTRLKPIVNDLAERTRAQDPGGPPGRFEDSLQERFCHGLLADIGFDDSRGRVDRSTHPFTLMAGEDDVRVTLRMLERNPASGILATLHEGGHALYDQGFPTELRGTLLADAPSTGLHEAQARLWENHVGRSRAFWSAYFPRLQALFPGQLDSLDALRFFNWINAVRLGTSRIEADEATYDLHILIRYELELALLHDDLQVRDLPSAWDEKSRSYLGVTASSMSGGCLQDVHWSLGEFGYFPTYTIGNLYAAQLIESYREATDLDTELARAEFSALRAWLAEHVYSWGCRLDAEPIIERATGRGLDPEAYFRLLELRFS